MSLGMLVFITGRNSKSGFQVQALNNLVTGRLEILLLLRTVNLLQSGKQILSPSSIYIKMPHNPCLATPNIYHKCILDQQKMKRRTFEDCQRDALSFSLNANHAPSQFAAINQSCLLKFTLKMKFAWEIFFQRI